MLLGMSALQGMQLDVIDITTCDELFGLYAESVPVLRLDEFVLPAPFAEADVEKWLRGLRKPE